MTTYVKLPQLLLKSLLVMSTMLMLLEFMTMLDMFVDVDSEAMVKVQGSFNVEAVEEILITEQNLNCSVQDASSR